MNSFSDGAEALSHPSNGITIILGERTDYTGNNNYVMHNYVKVAGLCFWSCNLNQIGRIVLLTPIKAIARGIMIMHLYETLIIGPVTELTPTLLDHISGSLEPSGWVRDPVLTMVWLKQPKDSTDADPDTLRLSLKQTLERVLREASETNSIHFIIQSGNRLHISDVASYPSAEESMKRFR